MVLDDLPSLAVSATVDVVPDSAEVGIIAVAGADLAEDAPVLQVGVGAFAGAA